MCPCGSSRGMNDRAAQRGFNKVPQPLRHCVEAAVAFLLGRHQEDLFRRFLVHALANVLAKSWPSAIVPWFSLHGRQARENYSQIGLCIIRESFGRPNSLRSQAVSAATSQMSHIGDRIQLAHVLTRHRTCLVTLATHFARDGSRASPTQGQELWLKA